MKLRGIVSTVAALSLFVAGAAQAHLITGEIAFFGSANLVDDTGAVTSTASATGIDFQGAYVNPLAAPTGDFAGIAGFTPLTEAFFTDFYFQGPNKASSLPVTPLWTVADFSFDLLDVTVVNQSSSNLTLSGTGIVKENGMHATQAAWYFSMDAGQTILGFSSLGIAGVAVPEPASILLLGLGIIALGLYGRRRQSAHIQA